MTVRLYAAIFRPDGLVRSVGKATVVDLNVDLRHGETWRAIPETITDALDVGAATDWPTHPDLVEPA